MNRQPAQPRPVAALLTQLTDLDVKLPEDVSRAAELLEAAADGSLTREAIAHPDPADVLTMSREDVLDHVRIHATLRLTADRLTESVWSLALHVAEAAAEAIRRDADKIIRQLAPRFDAAAEAVHAATQYGIQSRMTAEDIIALADPQAVAAWSDLAPHVATLSKIGAARIAMTDAADVAPSPDSFGPRQYGACFSPDSPQWEPPRGIGETGVDHWLRLSTGGPLRLLKVAETEAAARKWRATPTPVVPVSETTVTAEDIANHGHAAVMR